MEIMLLIMCFAVCILMIIGMAVTAFIKNILVFITLCIMIIVWIALIFAFRKFYNISHNPLFILNAIFVLGYYFIGFFLLDEFFNLDKNNQYLSFLHLDGGSKTFLTIAMVSAISLLILLISIHCKIVLQCILCILQISGTLCFTIFVILMCCQSYSNYFTKRIMLDNTFVEYTITENTNIYYPSHRSEKRIPSILPYKISVNKFDSSDIVFSNNISYTRSEDGYIEVSDGEKSGYVKQSSLKANENFVYDYQFICNQNNTPIYKAKIKERTNSAGQPYRSYSLSDTKEIEKYINKGEALTKVDYYFEESEYMAVSLPDGTEGYVSIFNIDLKKTK